MSKSRIVDMTLREWYKSPLSTGITHTSVEGKVEPQLIPSRVEFIYPQFNHQASYGFIRQSGLNSEMMSTFFLLKNDLLPSNETFPV